jgi:hypothetical protein
MPTPEPALPGRDGGPSDGPPSTPRTPRWIDRLTTGLLAASVGVTVGAATPAFLRAGGVELGSTVGPDSAAPLALPHRPPEILAHEGPLDLSVDADDDEGPLVEPGHAGAGQVGLTRGPLVLREQPAGAAPSVGDVEAGELVTILRVNGDWALVYYGGSGGLVVGWAKKSEIAVR